MANYVRVWRDDADEWPWRWACAICTHEVQYFQHRYALAWANEHARTCPGVRAATERDQALATLHRYRKPVQQ